MDKECFINSCKEEVDFICSCQSIPTYICKNHLVIHCGQNGNHVPQSIWFEINSEEKNNMCQNVKKVIEMLNQDLEEIILTSGNIIKSVTCTSLMMINRVNLMKENFNKIHERILQKEVIEKEIISKIESINKESLYKYLKEYGENNYNIENSEFFSKSCMSFHLKTFDILYNNNVAPVTKWVDTANTYVQLWKKLLESRNSIIGLEFFKTLSEIKEKYTSQILLDYFEINDHAFRNPGFTRVLSLYTNCLKIEEENYINKKIELAIIYNNQGVCFSVNRNYQKALEFFFKYIQIKEEDLQTYDSDLAKVYMNIGYALLLLRKKAKAEEYFMKILREQTFQVDDIFLARTYRMIGICLTSLKSRLEAMAYYQSFFTIGAKALKNNDILYSYIYINIADWFYQYRWLILSIRKASWSNGVLYKSSGS